jgi:histidinol-phosphate aminotransferase
MIANREFAGIFRSTIQSPYPISVLSLAIASGVLGRAEQVKKTIDTVRHERVRVMERLSSLKGIRIFRSDANFLFIESGRNSGTVSKALDGAGIVVKQLGMISGHRGCMRVTIGTPEMNDRFLQCVEGALS